jgi:acetyl-CoA carboxylase carboxyltransferase component
LSWHDEVEHIVRARQLAQEMGGPARIQRQHDAGKLTARERIGLLLDPGSFEEIGVLADHVSRREALADYSAPADGVVTGMGSVAGRTTFVLAEDFTTLGGSVGRTGMRKRHRIRELAARELAPIVYLLDGAGARTQDFVNAGWVGGEPFLQMARMSGVIPQVVGVLGPLAGDPALEVPLCDFKVMVKGSGMLAAAGPPLVAAATGIELSKEELGGWRLHTRTSGTVDIAVDDDADAIAAIRTYLAYLPGSCYELPPEAPASEPSGSPEDLLTLVPQNRKQPYDMRGIIKCLADADTMFELQAEYGRALLVGLARIEGHVVGVQANQPMVRAGAFGAEEADKCFHFLQLCNSFNIPVLFLTDVPGLMVGTAAEANATLRRGLRIASVMAYMRTPTVSVLIRKAYGMGAVVMNGPGGNQSLTLAWPSTEFGAMPAHGGVAAAHRRAISAAGDPAETEAAIERQYASMGGVLDAARAFDFDDLVDPRETRSRVARAFRRARVRQQTQLGPWQYSGILP